MQKSLSETSLILYGNPIPSSELGRRKKVESHSAKRVNEAVPLPRGRGGAVLRSKARGEATMEGIFFAMQCVPDTLDTTENCYTVSACLNLLK